MHTLRTKVRAKGLSGQQLRRIFIRADKDGSGGLNLGEFREARGE